MKIRTYTSSDQGRWNRYVENSGEAHIYHLAEWRDVVRNSFGHETIYLLSEDDQGTVTGILPMVHLNSVLFGNYLVSLPYFNYGGICANAIEIYRDLAEEAVRVARSKGADHLELREARPVDNGLRTKSVKVSMRLDLPESADDLDKLFLTKLRSQIRRPEKEGMFCHVGRTDELDAFYNVFSINMRDLGTPVYSKHFFRNILDAFPRSSWISTVYKDRTPVASGFLLGFKERLEIPWASSLQKYNRFSPNMLLYRSALEFACRKGFRLFDFGRSTPGEGTYRFKEQWGAKPIPLYWHYWVRDDEPLPELNPKNPKYRLAIKIWRKLPVSVTRWIGPSIVKNLP